MFAIFSYLLSGDECKAVIKTLESKSPAITPSNGQYQTTGSILLFQRFLPYDSKDIICDHCQLRHQFVALKLSQRESFNIPTDVTGNDTAGMVAGMVASGVTAKGLNGIEAEANKLAKAPKGIDGVTEGAGNLAEDVGKAGKGLEGAAKGAESAAEDAGKVVESGSSSGKVWDYSKQFDGELANFNAGYEIKNVIKEDLYLVQFHSNAEVGSGRSLKYWTTFDAANRISTVDDYMNQMALLSNWGARDNVSIAKIPAGTKIKYAIGTAKEQVGAIESRPGGGLQILFEKFDDGWVLDTRPLP